jgi:hypothetical protein
MEAAGIEPALGPLPNPCSSRGFGERLDAGAVDKLVESHPTLTARGKVELQGNWTRAGKWATPNVAAGMGRPRAESGGRTRVRAPATLMRTGREGQTVDNEPRAP